MCYCILDELADTSTPVNYHAFQEELISKTIRRRDDIPLFARKPVRDLFLHYQDLVTNKLKSPSEFDAKSTIVSGVPGSGKSLTTWAFIKSFASNMKLKFGWYNLKLGVLLIVDLLCNPPMIYHHDIDLFDELTVYLNDPSITIWIFDSVQSENATKAHSLITKLVNHAFVIALSSMQFVMSYEEKCNVSAASFEMPAWQLEEYYEASIFDTVRFLKL